MKIIWRIIAYFSRIPGPESIIWDACRYKKKGHLLTGTPEYDKIREAYLKYKNHPIVRATDWG